MMTLDDKDRHMSHILAREGWISNLDLAECVAFSPSATLHRVQNLGPAPVIAGCRAVLSPDKMGVGFVAWLAVGLSDHSKRSQVAFERAMQGAAAVRECHNITGTVNTSCASRSPTCAPKSDFTPISLARCRKCRRSPPVS
jgi:DNA-binding Lrp family transcriptional regulator